MSPERAEVYAVRFVGNQPHALVIALRECILAATREERHEALTEAAEVAEFQTTGNVASIAILALRDKGEA